MAKMIKYIGIFAFIFVLLPNQKVYATETEIEATINESEESTHGEELVEENLSDTPLTLDDTELASYLQVISEDLSDIKEGEKERDNGIYQQIVVQNVLLCSLLLYLFIHFICKSPSR